MLRLNRGGFALVETLIVSAVVMTLITILYTNFYPMMGEYNKRENYDDIDSIYNTYLIKNFLETSKTYGKDFNEIKKDADDSSKGSKKIFTATYDKDNASFQKDTVYCNQLTNANEELQRYCKNLFFETNTLNVYLTTYNISNLKKNLNNYDNDYMDSYTKDYIETLPYYSKKENNNGYSYRIIVEYVKEINKESENSRKEIYAFSTMGVEL